MYYLFIYFYFRLFKISRDVRQKRCWNNGVEQDARLYGIITVYKNVIPTAWVPYTNLSWGCRGLCNVQWHHGVVYLDDQWQWFWIINNNFILEELRPLILVYRNKPKCDYVLCLLNYIQIIVMSIFTNERSAVH